MEKIVFQNGYTRVPKMIDSIEKAKKAFEKKEANGVKYFYKILIQSIK